MDERFKPTEREHKARPVAVDCANMEAKGPSQSTSRIVHWMGIADANSAGFIHGGTVMKLADEAAGIAAIKHSRRRVVTAGMDRMTFLIPIHIGQLVTFTA